MGHAVTCNVVVNDIVIWERPSHNGGALVGLDSLNVFCLTHQPVAIPLPQCFCLFDGLQSNLTSCVWRRARVRDYRNGDFYAACPGARCKFIVWLRRSSNRSVEQGHGSLRRHHAMISVPSRWSARLTIAQSAEILRQLGPIASASNLSKASAPPVATLASSELTGSSSSSSSHVIHNLSQTLSIPSHPHGSVQELSALRSLSSTGLQSCDLQALVNALEKCDLCGRCWRDNPVRCRNLS